MEEAFQANSTLPAPSGLAGSSAAISGLAGSSAAISRLASYSTSQTKSLVSKKVSFYFHFYTSSLLNTFHLPGKKECLRRQTYFYFY